MRERLQFWRYMLNRHWCGWRSRRQGHGELLVGTDQLFTVCDDCGWFSTGITIETARVRRAWRFSRHRQYFRRAS